MSTGQVKGQKTFFWGWGGQKTFTSIKSTGDKEISPQTLTLINW